MRSEAEKALPEVAKRMTSGSGLWMVLVNKFMDFVGLIGMRDNFSVSYYVERGERGRVTDLSLEVNTRAAGFR